MLAIINIIEHTPVIIRLTVKSLRVFVCINIPKLYISGGIYLPILGTNPVILKSIKIKNATNVAGVMLFDTTLENNTIVRIKIKYINNRAKNNITSLVFIKVSSNSIFV